jgi:hypothetical protein
VNRLADTMMVSSSMPTIGKSQNAPPTLGKPRTLMLRMRNAPVAEDPMDVAMNWRWVVADSGNASAATMQRSYTGSQTMRGSKSVWAK